MTFSGPALYNRLHRTPNYIAKSGWTTTVGWRREGTMSTKALANRILGSASFRFNILAKKFQLTLEHPSDQDFPQDWEPAIRALEHTQNTIANSSEKRYRETCQVYPQETDAKEPKSLPTELQKRTGTIQAQSG
ncbi:hypothetical protein FPV67DRAFT_1451986 [Lyophyllum atratum]|nr:hypothetical protein FPV67DRAFT_1451986 [Lyophyllum atratum]